MQQKDALLGYTRGKLKTQINRILRVGGITIWCGWNSTGMGKKQGFEIKEILLVCHGSDHNDTICIVEEKIMSQGSLVPHNKANEPDNKIRPAGGQGPE